MNISLVQTSYPGMAAPVTPEVGVDVIDGLQLITPAPVSGRSPDSQAEREKAFQRVVREYGASLYFFVLKRVGHPDEAADIAQQAFVEAACNFDRFRGEAELSTWIFGIAVNLSLNHVNRSPSRRHAFESEEILEGCESPFADPQRETCQRELLDLVGRGMRSLPEDMVRALTLVTIDGMSYAEAAELLRVPVGTVRSRVSRARSALRNYCARAGEAEPY